MELAYEAMAQQSPYSVPGCYQWFIGLSFATAKQPFSSIT
jgi:hypothetical protein